jgi:two-component system C4-dicarboxylate transport sensor histidine kinase DctB
VYVIIFTVILLVSWLSKRDIDHSLRRARRSEAALRRERNSLEIKVAERTRELEQAQVEKMLELHRFAEFGRFTSTLLHELANPLTSVSLELEQLASTQESAMIRQARKGVAHMEEYVTAARRQLRNQSEERIFDAGDEIRRVVAFLEPKARNHQIRLIATVSSGLLLFGDSIKFDQIIANLIANAIDAHDNHKPDKKRPVRIQARQKSGFVEIIVTDHGVGIQNHELLKIFEPFYTTKVSERGTGIGLAITKRAVEEFEGTITAASSPASGTTFTVRLPAYEP